MGASTFLGKKDFLNSHSSFHLLAILRDLKLFILLNSNKIEKSKFGLDQKWLSSTDYCFLVPVVQPNKFEPTKNKSGLIELRSGIRLKFQIRIQRGFDHILQQASRVYGK